MAPVTEIAYITLKPGVELTGSSPSAQAWSDALSAISAQEGYQRQHWGVSLEDPSLLMLLIGMCPSFVFTLPRNLITKLYANESQTGTELKATKNS